MNRILVVDDEPHTLRAIERIFLDKENVELDFADNGATGLEKVQSFSPDAVLLDIAMPGMDGYEVCRRIKSNSSTAGIMVLLVSAK
ncbi:MAG: response regulator, partial [Desulfobulbaceae bacterium]|nr:response regulator [Desulfobulbaceae bacterium]